MRHSLSPLVVFAILSLTTVAYAAEVNVASTKELGSAIKSVQPGDTIILADGAYNDAEIKFYGQGSEQQPITLRAATPGKVLFTGKSSLRIGGSWLVVDGITFTQGFVSSGHAIAFRGEHDAGATNCRLTNCAFIDYNPPADQPPKGNTQWLSMYGANNRVDHCYFKGKNTSGPMLVVWVEKDPNNHRIDHNFFAGRPPLGRNGGETIRVGTSEVSMNNSRTIIEENYFEHCDGEAEIISNKSCENIHRYNTFVECKGAVVTRHGNRCEIYGNWFFGHGVDGTGGIRLIGEDHKIYNNYLDGLAGKEFESALPIVNGIPNSKPNEYFRVQRAIIAFNTVVNCTQNLTFGIGVGKRNRAEPAMNVTVANNIIVGNEKTEPPLVKFDDKPIDTKWIGNIFFGATLSAEKIDDAREVDPKLAKSSDEIYRPSKDSPAIGTAAGDFAFISEDIEGRPRGDKKDVGAFQMSNDAPAKRRPLTAKDVGPSWMSR